MERARDNGLQVVKPQPMEQNLSSLTEIILSVCVQPSYKDFQDRVGSDVM